MATITGTDGPDTLTETFDSDIIEGLDGDDVIILDKGQATGVDRIYGGEGSDRLVIHRPSGIFLAAIAPPPSTQHSGSTGGALLYMQDIEHYTIYHLTGEGSFDNIFAGNGDDIYYFTATNNQNPNFNNQVNQVDLGGGLNDLLSIDASGVFGWGVTVQPINGGRSMFWVGSVPRINFISVNRLELIGGALGDIVVGMSGDDVIDGRDGNDTLTGNNGNDVLIGGNGNDSLTGGIGNDRLVDGSGNDSLDGGEGDDTLAFSAGTDNVAGGNGTDRLEIDARGVGGAVSFDIGPGGGPYAGGISYAGGTVNFSGIEDFTVYSNPGNYGDDVNTGWGYDSFYHYGINSLDYAMDRVDLGEAGVDLLVADFSAVTDHAVANSVHPTLANHYQFTVGGAEKVRYTNVERIHFIGGAQGDSVTGLGLDDILEGRGGNDSLTGLAGDDDIAGGTGTNAIDAGDDDDIIRSVSFAIDTVQGGAGNDTAIIDYSAQTAAVTNIAGGDIAFGNGTDTSVTLTGVERFIVTTGSGNDVIATLGGNDEIRTGAGTDTIDAGAGDDYLDGGSGIDSMTGGDGNDVYVVDDSGDTIVEATGEGTDLVYASAGAYVLADNVENLTATNGIAHQFRGNGGNNVITGGSGVDTILLQDGGDDTVNGRSGNDIFYFGTAFTGADRADGGGGRDAVVLQGNYTVTFGNSSLTRIESVSLQSGANAQFGDTANNFYDFNLTMADGNVAAGQQLIVNGQSLRDGEDFTFDGSAETNGKFLVYGGHGVDDLTGGADADIFFFEGARWGASDKVDGGAGRDALVISGGTGLVHIEFAADSLTSIESISVNKQLATDQTQLPSYDLVLANGNVTPGGTLIVNGSSLVDVMQTINIDGGDVQNGNLILFGGAGNDIITAGAGFDLIVGGGRADALTGGASADIFRYDATSDSAPDSPDLIGDFQTGLDKIDLSRIDANTHVAGNQAFTWIGSNAFTGSGSSSGELRVYQDSGYWRVEGDTNGDGNADLVIVFQLGTAAVVQGDFLF